MRFAAGSVKHFGLHMYSTPVPAIAEMVSNAWDADATDVWIDIPMNQAIEHASEITIRDNGAGMTYDECNDAYLVVGRNRREADKTDRSPGGRPLMAHKGLGKFAPFGIADLVQVRTIKNGKRTVFEMDYRQMVPQRGSAKDEFVKTYYPKVIDAEVATRVNADLNCTLSPTRIAHSGGGQPRDEGLRPPAGWAGGHEGAGT